MKVVKKVEYVLQKPLRKKGEIGDVVKVTRGFGRYLESQGIANRANTEVLKNLEINKKFWLEAEAVNDKIARELIEKIKDVKVVLKKRVAQGEKLYDSVRPEHIVEGFKAHGIQLQNNNIKLNNQIKKIGTHNIIVHAYGNHEIEMEINVVSESEDMQ